VRCRRLAVTVLQGVDTMRVVVVTNMYPSERRPWWGIFVRDQVEDLRCLGVDVELLAFNGWESRLAYLRGARDLRRLVSRGGVDLVHAHYGLSGAVAVTQRRASVVTTFHGSDCDGDERWQVAVSWLVARRSTPIFVSGHLADRLGINDAAVVPAAVDIDLFRPSDRAVARRALGWSLEAKYALLPGSRADGPKRADLFDAAVAHARASVPGLLGASLDGLSRKGVVHAMNAADVTVMTSDNEGSPVAVKESLACCTPVVSVPVGDVPALLNGLPGCSTVARDPRGLGEALVAAMEAGRSSELRLRAERYSRARIAGQIVDVYRKVLEGGRGRRTRP
jgi:Glycosyl transferase 4-like domain/Glycosyl transferases group 1